MLRNVSLNELERNLMQDKIRQGDHSDSGTSSRIIKKIQLEIYEDHEASFYLALSLLKASQKIDKEQVKLLLDSIHYSDQDTDRVTKVQEELKTAWGYLHRAGKHSEDYSKVSGETFEGFSLSEFGQSIGNVLQHFSIFKEVALHGENILAKTQMSLLSRLLQALKEPVRETSKTEMSYKYKSGTLQKGKIEQASDGIFKVTQPSGSDGIETEFYLQQDGLIKKVLSFSDFRRPDFEALYIKTKDSVLKIRQDESFLYYSNLSGVVVRGDTIDLSNATEANIEQRPRPPLSMLEEPTISGNEVEIGMPSIDMESSISIQHEISLTNDKPVGIIKELESIYHIPDNVRKDLYLRQKAVTAIFGEVNKFFPDMTSYAKSIVTGYLCIPLDIVDAEEVHEQSERTQTYHEYLGKTVRNTLKSKPFAS